MSIPNEPIIMLSVVNTMLRDKYNSLDELCYNEDISREMIESRLISVGYKYVSKLNQFK